MWEDDKIWLPLLLKGQDPFFGRMYFKRKSTGEQEQVDAIEGASAFVDATLANHSTTMTSTPFTKAEPKPFYMSDYHLELDLTGVPKEVALDGTVVAFQN
ncbi:unnamed protein product [Mortierella alpina]